MRVRSLLLTAVLTLIAARLSAQTPTPDALVRQLGSENYAERENAARQLGVLGPKALEALRRAVREGDLEVQRRVRELVRRLERQVETAKFTEPTRLRLSYQGENLAQVVNDLGKKASLSIKFDPRVKFKEITLQTEEITFWEALDRVCVAGNVQEVAPVPLPFPQDQNVPSTSVMMIGRRAMAYSTDILQREPLERVPELRLAAGKPVALPTYTSGAIRVQVRPPGTVIPGQPREPDDHLLVLDVALEGKVQWHRGLGVRLEKALTEKGQSLTLRTASYRPPLGSRSGIAVNGIPIDPEPDEPGPAGRLVPLRLHGGGESVTKLSELVGTVIGQVWLPIEPLVKVERILEAEGKSARGRHGGAIRVLEVEKEDNELRIRAFIEAAPRGLTAPQPLPITGRIMVNGRSIADSQDLLSSGNFQLTDEKGRPFLATRAVATGRRDGVAHEYELTYGLAPGLGTPSTFVYVDRRMMYLDIPFVLKDVPLK